MSPEMSGKRYEIGARTLPGEREEEHRMAYRSIDIANDFLRGLNPSKVSNPSGYFIKYSTISALTGFLSRVESIKFVTALFAGLNPVVRFTRDQDSTFKVRYKVEWVNGEIGPTSSDD